MAPRTADGWQLRRATRAAGLVLATAGGLLGTGAALAGDDAAPPLAPDFALKSTSGQNLRLSEYRGQPVLLTFWADWCGTCQPQLADLADLARRHADHNVAVLAVNIDGTDRREVATTAAARLGITVLRDDAQAVARSYDLGALPVTVLVDQDGYVRGSWSRHRPETLGEVEAALARVIAE
jgi:peroxiredoxin